jgi:DNA-binding transcriptional MerR regulator
MTLTDPPTTAADLDDATLSIAAAAERSGVSAHTLRYYEQLGLVTPERDENDRRRYGAADLARVRFLTVMRRSQMPVADLVHYVDLVRQGPATEPERLALLEAHRADILDRQQALTDALFLVDYKIAVYGGATGDPERMEAAASLLVP